LIQHALIVATFGHRCTADFFLESAVDDGTHACSYLLATDMNMEPVPGYKYANWEAGYGDIHLVPDLRLFELQAGGWVDILLHY
jgi:glutamine synthetase